MRKIILNQAFMDKNIELNPSVKKDRFNQFQSDFEIKMDKMNKVLEKGVEAQISEEGSHLERTGAF